MLKRVSPDQVRLGMFVHSFDGGWLSHPFWRSQFHLTDPEDLERVHSSKVRAVIIDAAKNLDTVSPAERPAVPPCIDTDRAPDHLARPVAARSPGDFGKTTEPPPFRRYRPASASGADTDASATAERAQMVRAFAESSRAVQQAFKGVIHGRRVSLDALSGVVDQISDVMTRNRAMMIGISRLKSKDEYTFYHSVAVGALMLGLARELGLDEETARALALGGLVHDVGKMKMPHAILNKPGPLTEEEFAEMRRHPELGYEMLAADGVASPIVLEVTLRHHERLDGKGYPGGISGDQLSLYARIAAICDVFDALTSARAYKEAMPSHQAIAMMASWEGHFDRDVLIVFMRSIGLYPAGMLVRLSSDRIGIVLPSGRKPGRPRARAFHCAITDTPLPWSDVVISDQGQGERVVDEAHPEDWATGDWADLCERLLAAPAQRAA